MVDSAFHVGMTTDILSLFIFTLGNDLANVLNVAEYTPVYDVFSLDTYKNDSYIEDYLT